MPSRDMRKCTDFLIHKEAELQRRAAEMGIRYVVTCTARTSAEHTALFAQGRLDLERVNSLRKFAGLAPITATENERCVTWTQDSPHVLRSSRPYARAFDVAIVDKQGRVTWDVKGDVNADNLPDYEQLAAIGREIGLRCGADFKDRNGRSKPDYPHFEEP